MSRLTIDITEQQHQALKAMAALEGKTIKQFTLERLFQKGYSEKNQFDELKTLLASRVAEAQTGNTVEGSITEIAEQTLQKKSTN